MKTYSFTFTEQHHQIALTLLSGIGSKRARIILGYFADLEEFFFEKKLNLNKIPGIPADFVNLKQRRSALEEADKIIARLGTLSADTLFLTDPEYPRRLKNCDDAPLLLYRRGKMDLNAGKTVAIVGTRHATEYGRQLTEELIQELTETDALVVSGMAYGIDVMAHRSALTAGMQTVGVLGHGIDYLYPALHRKTAEKMCARGGLLTELPPGFKPEPAYFPMRNRIVAGLSDAVVVVESGPKGGSLITAGQAFDYNRDVFTFPGDVTRQFSQGCLKLIQQDKARLLISPADLVKSMSWRAEERKTGQQQKIFVELTADQQLIMDILNGNSEMVIDAIACKTQLPVSRVSTLLLDLEFKGAVRSRPGKKYVVV